MYNSWTSTRSFAKEADHGKQPQLLMVVPRPTGLSSRGRNCNICVTSAKDIFMSISLLLLTETQS